MSRSEGLCKKDKKPQQVYYNQPVPSPHKHTHFQDTEGYIEICESFMTKNNTQEKMVATI